jgi:hypothetical protein
VVALDPALEAAGLEPLDFDGPGFLSDFGLEEGEFTIVEDTQAPSKSEESFTSEDEKTDTDQASTSSTTPKPQAAEEESAEEE